MSTRKLLTLTLVFLALLAFVVFFERHLPTSEEAAKAKKRLLDFKVEDVAGLAIERPDLPKVELSKKAPGKWVLKGDRGGPADSVTADGFVSDLSRLELFGETRTAFEPKDYGLDAPKAKVTLEFKDGAKKTILFGKPIPGTDATAAAEGSRMGAIKFPPTATLAKPYDEFRSRALFDVPTSEITQVTITRGPNKVVVARDAGDEKTPAGPWRIEAPVKDLASASFVEQLLADLGSARVSEFPVLGQADLSRVGLQPPTTAVLLQKGPEVVANLAFGATKADATGKIYARRDSVALVIDDRVQDSLAKELSAFRETKLLGLDTWNVNRLLFESPALRTGAEKVEGEWRSAGNQVEGHVVDDIVDKVVRADVKRFVPSKEYAAIGVVPARGGKEPVAAGAIELSTDRTKAPVKVAFFTSPTLSAQKLIAVEATGRGDGMLVESATWDQLKALAAKLKAESETKPTIAAPPTRPTSKAPAAPSRTTPAAVPSPSSSPAPATPASKPTATRP